MREDEEDLVELLQVALYETISSYNGTAPIRPRVARDDARHIVDWLNGRVQVAQRKERNRGPYPRVTCPIDGCTVWRGGWQPDTVRHRNAVWFIERHAAEPHDRCACGWAGVKLSTHIGMMKRRHPGELHMSAPMEPSFI